MTMKYMYYEILFIDVIIKISYILRFICIDSEIVYYIPVNPICG